MILAEESLNSDDLNLTLTQLQDQVRKHPANFKYRVFLFQLLSVMGSWDRALTQLNVCGDLDAAALAMVQTYREALGSEALRAEVFAGTRSPLFFGKPDQWMALLLEALKKSGEGEFSQFSTLMEQALEEAPLTSGTINDEAFEWIADGDSRIGPFLEAIVNGNYYWIPFHLISEIIIEEPEDLRDMIWMPAQFTWANMGKAVGLIPTRYPGSELSSDAKIQRAQKTEWIEQGENVYTGLGQRMLVTDANEYPLMDIRKITLNSEIVRDDQESS